MGIRSEIVSELGWRFGKLAAWAVDQSKLAPSVVAMAGTAAERPTLALVGFINGPFFAVHGSGGDDPQFTGAKGEIEVERSAGVGTT